MADARAVVEQWLDAMEARDAERILELMADDVTMETEAFRGPIIGKQVIEDLLAGAMDAYESIDIDRRKIIESGNEVAALVEIRVRFGDDIEMFGERLSVKGKQLHVLGALFAEVNEAGEIARLMRVRDNLSVMQQLGLSPHRMEELVRKFVAAMERSRRAA